MSVFKIAGGRWRVQIRRKTVRVDEVFESRDEALQAERKALGRAVDSHAITVSELWSRYVESSDFSSKSEHTQATEKCRIKPVLAVLGNYAVAQFENDRGPIHEFMDARARAVSPRTGKKLSKATLRLELAALAAIVAFGIERRVLRENFLKTIKRPVAKPRRRRVEPGEHGKLRLAASGDGPSNQAARFLLLVRHLGCRPGELMKLRRHEVRLDRRDITFLDTKNGRDRIVHVTTTAYELLDIQQSVSDRDCPYLFGTWSAKEGRWVPYNYAYGLRLLRSAGIVETGYHAHAGRREFISHAIEHGLDLMTIKKQTGHKSTQALEIYDQASSTAPEIRRRLDELASSVKEEAFKEALFALARTDEQRRMVDELVHGKDAGWRNPFPD